eukprot:TRINITY_DN1198_c0_g1_i8.p1 TRINITY_DN1198_c0_g1~~TRINITY_DN1198_c0_g1_i8.p1  ORF type:complete len:700 (-),score=234.61 TRINITY_DN1198_c0_g1_i8:1888-3987(-)
MEKQLVNAFKALHLDECFVEYLTEAAKDMSNEEFAEYVSDLGIIEDEKVIKSLAKKVNGIKNRFKPKAPKKVETVSKKLSQAEINKSMNDLSVQDDQTRMMWSKDAIRKATNDQIKMSKRAQRKAARDERKKNRKGGDKSAAKEVVIHESESAIVSNKINCLERLNKKTVDIHLNNISMGFPGNMLLANASMDLVNGRRYGLIGRNGVGKTTLLHAIAKHDIENFPSDVHVIHVQQEMRGDDLNSIETIIKSHQEIQDLKDIKEAILHAIEKGDVSQSDQITKIQNRLDELDASNAEQNVNLILDGLGFSKDMRIMPTRELSGGWRMRLALGCALYIQPDLLLLDEPTNFIDLVTVAWLEDRLLSYPRTVVIVSHDKCFLNRCITDVVHLHDCTLTQYRGDYDNFENVREARLKEQQRVHESIEMKKAHMQKFIDRFRFNAKRASLVQSRLKAIKKLDVIDAVKDDPRWAFEFPEPDQLPAPVMQISDVTFGYTADKILFRDCNIGIDLDSRVAILGPNGAGKSTLLKLMIGELEPISGYVRRHSHLQIAVFNQHHMDQLKFDLTACECLKESHPSVTDDAIRNHLGRFGLSGDLAVRPIRTLSGGQKSRVSLALITLKRPQLLILDEISNHLDIDTIDALMLALSTFSGGCVFVSHDEYFLQSVAQELWVVDDQRVTKYKKSIADFKKETLKKAAMAK